MSLAVEEVVEENEEDKIQSETSFSPENEGNASTICDICCFPIKGRKRAKIECPHCAFFCCRDCVQNYLLSSELSPHCMKCKKNWGSHFLFNNTKTFINRKYKKHRKQVLYNTEISKIPEIMPSVECNIRIQKINNIVKLLDSKLSFFASKPVRNILTTRRISIFPF